MTRNLHERCEVVFPVADPALKRRLREEILGSYLDDNLKARLMNPDGSYQRAPKATPALSAQLHLMDLSRSPDKRLTRDKTTAVESTPAEEAESVLSKEQSGL
jgi:polyphosphate kinase